MWKCSCRTWPSDTHMERCPDCGHELYQTLRVQMLTRSGAVLDVRHRDGYPVAADLHPPGSIELVSRGGE